MPTTEAPPLFEAVGLNPVQLAALAEPLFWLACDLHGQLRLAAVEMARLADLLDAAPPGEFAGGVVAGELRKLSAAANAYLQTVRRGKGVGSCSAPA